MPAEIVLVNPRRKKRRKVARTHARRRRRSSTRSHKRVSRRRARNPIFRRRRSRAHNPRISIRTATGYVIPALTGAVGAVALNVALSYLPIPESLKTGWANVGVKAVGAIGLGFLVSKFVNKRTGMLFTGGAMTVLAYQVVSDLATSMLGDKVKGVAGYQDFQDYRPVGAYQRGIGYINPAPVLGAYQRPGMAGLSGLGTLSGDNYGAGDGMN